MGSQRAGVASRMAPSRRKKLRHKESHFKILVSVFVFCTTFFLSLAYLKLPGEPHKKSSKTAKPFPQNSGISCNFYAGSERKANITTTELYDSLLFDNMEGGVWRQGWEIKYNGNEWDNHKLRVFVVPHSHNDPGWIRTVEEYFLEKTKHILNTIITTLSKDKKRKFIWEEMSYLQRWWLDAPMEKKIKMKNLIQNGQLEIVGGGWVMNDEANSHYFAIVDQITEGNNWLLKEIGIVPKNAWSIDPFGHSPTMAYIYKQMGFQSLVIQRTHYEVKRILARNQNLEFFWRQNWDHSNSTDFLTHMMPFYSYDVPHTCGPDPSICCQFDFARMWGVGAASPCPWHIPPEAINDDNVKDRAFKLLDQYRKKSILFRSNVVLIPLGDDFRYVNLKEADAQYLNYEKLFEYMNSRSDWNVEIKWGTLNDYFTTLKEEARNQNLIFPSLSGDFFTYADVNQDYWSGYYTSRPYFKAMDRSLEAYLRSAEIIFTLVYSFDPAVGTHSFPHRHANHLVYARRQLALFQHHDGVTGTAKNHVMIDYANRMFLSLTKLQKFMSEAVEFLLNPPTEASKNSLNSDLEFFLPETKRSAYDALPERQVIDIGEGEIRRLVFFNSLEETTYQVVSVIVNSPRVVILNSQGQCIQSQIMPVWESHTSSTLSLTGHHRVYWNAKIPALGLQTYFVSESSNFPGCPPPEVSTLEIFNSPSNFNCPNFYPCQKISSSTESYTQIENNYYILKFGTSDGMLTKVKHLGIRKAIKMEEEFAYYRTFSSGAYLFKPNGDAKNGVHAGGLVIVSRGSLVQECHLQAKFKDFDGHNPISRTSRLYAGYTPQGTAIEMTHDVEMNRMEMDDVEIVVRYKTDIQNHKVWYSDINGFQTMRRETLDKIPLQGNYYPMPSSAFLQDNFGKRFSVHTRQAVGVASLKDGWLEMMLDRRLVQDDQRGLNQGVTDNHPMKTVFSLVLESNVSTILPLPHSSALFHSLVSHRINSQLNYPPLAFYGKKELVSFLKISFSNLKLNLDGKELDSSKIGNFFPSFFTLSSNLPCDFHIVNFKVQELESLSQGSKPLVSLILNRRGYDCNFNVYLSSESVCHPSTDGEVQFKEIWKKFQISNFNEVLLSLVGPKSTKKVNGENLETELEDGVLKLLPMEMKAFKFGLNLPPITTNSE